MTNNPIKQHQSVFFEPLDAIRFLAFCTVFTVHLFQIKHPLFNNGIFHFINYNIVSRGYLSLCVFFILSAFLITYLAFSEQQKKGSLHTLKFYIRRMLRIWPLYVFILIFIFLITPLIWPEFKADISRWPWFALFAGNFDILYNGMPSNPLLLPLWSIAVEEQFYLFFPITFLLFLGKKRILLFYSLIALIVIAVRYYYSSNYMAHGIHTLSVMGDFATGSAMAALFFFNEKFREKFVNLKQSTILLIYIIAIAVILIKRFDYNLPGSLISRLVYDVFFAFVIAEQCFCKNSIFKVNKISIFNSLGKVSYGLYLFHAFGLLAAEKIVEHYIPINNWKILLITIAAIAMSITILCSYISYYTIEKPFNDLRVKYR
jgi:peptidoglycan/LPS O-acetylase OafA/YrhL